MPRQARINLPGAIYHVITRGIERKEIFKDDQDREEFLKRLGEAIKVTESRCYAWSLMPNHLHLIVRTGTKSLSELMRKILTGYAIYYNRRHRRHGYLYQNRYKSILCQEEIYLRELVRYVHLNPVRSKTVKAMEELDKYKWTGHSAIVGKERREWQTTGEILERFGKTRKEAVKKYRDYVAEGVGMGKREDLTGGGLRRSAGGWTEVLGMKKNKEYWRGDERVLGDGEFVNAVLKKSEEKMERRTKIKQTGMNLERLTEQVCSLIKIKKEDLRKKGKNNQISKAKGVIIYWGKRELGYSGTEIGHYLGISRQAVSYMLSVGEKHIKRDNYILTF